MLGFNLKKNLNSEGEQRFIERTKKKWWYKGINKRNKMINKDFWLGGALGANWKLV